MTELEQAIVAAYATPGEQTIVNRVYACLLRSTLWLPVQREQIAGDTEPYRPLYAVLEEKCFMPLFDSVERLEAWAGETLAEIRHVSVLGREVIASVGDTVYLALNPGVACYKEFSSEEVKYLKKVVGKLAGMVQPDAPELN